MTSAYGYPDTADSVLNEHAAHDECGNAHHQCPDCTDDDQDAAPEAVTTA
ncbi:hypothetical protein ACFW9I_37085 [[Kitasatospora] papulosa]